jgi:hypothetical protein
MPEGVKWLGAMNRFIQLPTIEEQSIPRRRHTIGFLKVSYEVTFIIQPNAMSDFLNAEETSFQEMLCLFHPQNPQILYWGHADFGFKKVTKPPGRQVYREGEFTERQISVEIVSHHFQDSLYSRIHATSF